MSAPARIALLATLATACSSSGANAPAGTLFGGVNVEIIKDSYTAFTGIFYDAPALPMMPLDASMSQGGCQLLVPRQVSCAPACADGTACTGVNRCSKTPVQVGVGTLHVEGLGPTALDLEPTQLNYQAVPTLPYPACAEGGDVTISASAFSAASKCIADLEVTSAVPIPVTSGQPMHLAWKAPGRTGISRVQIALEISHHGGYRGEIDCDVADTGAFDIPAPLVTALIALGRAGYPTVHVARAATAAAASEPGVKLVVMSQLDLDVDTGVISCGADGSPPCPAGTACQPDHTCS